MIELDSPVVEKTGVRAYVAGDFRRRTRNGSPVVSHPTITTKRKGRKADLLAAAAAEGVEVPAKVTVPELHGLLGGVPADVTYSRASGLGKPLADSTALEIRDRRLLAVGLALRPDLVERLAGVAGDYDPAAGLDRDGRGVADSVVGDALEAASNMFAADQGTAVHSVVEWSNCGRVGAVPVPADVFGISRELTLLVADSWERLLADNDLVVLSAETRVCSDEWGAAGSADVLVRTGRALPFVMNWGGLERVVTVPADTVVVADVKTGSLPGDGPTPPWWDGYLLQGDAYASAVPYDTATDRRGVWPHDAPSREACLIAHLDVARLKAEGVAVWSLLAGDLSVAALGAEALAAVDRWRDAPKWARAATSTVVELGDGDVVGSVEVSVVDGVEGLRARLRARWERLDDWGRAQFAAAAPDMDDLEAVAAVLDSVDPFAGSAGVPQPLAVPDVPVSPAVIVGADPGVFSDGAMFDTCRDAYGRLGPAALGWVNDVCLESKAAGAPLGLGDAATDRRVLLVLGLVLLADDFVSSDDCADVGLLVRELVRVAGGAGDAVTLGAAVGSLDLAGADRFSDLVADLVAGRCGVVFDAGGVSLSAEDGALFTVS